VSPDWVSGYSIAYGADYLLHDAQYSEEEYPEKVGWGHSSTDHVVSFASIAKVEHLVMFHHDPLHSDAHLEAMLARSAELWGEDGDPPVLAHEGMELVLE
jgi:ribonuclease BN (tRNA processing enzyme)